MNYQSLSGKKNPLDHIAKSFSKKSEVIVIDEFQVEDIADAMISWKFTEPVN
jgi:predicted ATPase